MRKDYVEPDSVRALKFGPLRRNPRVAFEVRSDRKVTTYLVDDMGLEDFLEGKSPKHYAGYSDRRNHQAELTLPNFSRYHLLIVNKSPDNPAKVEYDIKYA